VFIEDELVFDVENEAHELVKAVGVRVGRVEGALVIEGCIVGDVKTSPFATTVLP
jgi:hypothetical protein